MATQVHASSIPATGRDRQAHRKDARVAILLIGATLAAYGQIWSNDFVNFDDDVSITRNPHLITGFNRDNLNWALTSMHTGNWHPLTWLSLQLDASLTPVRGPDPRVFHGTNLVLHLANALLLYGFWRRATGQVWPSAFVAGLFALHPLHVESVAWAAERKDVLSTFLAFVALRAYAAYTRRTSLVRYVAMALAFALSLAAKPMFVTLPLLLLVLDWWPLRRLTHSSLSGEARFPFPLAGQLQSEREDNCKLQIGEHLRSLPSGGGELGHPVSLPPCGEELGWGVRLAEKLPLFALTAAACAVTLHAQSKAGATGALAGLSLLARLNNALMAYVIYLKKMICPVGLAPFYPHPLESLPWWQPALAGALLTILTALVLRQARRRPAFLVGWLWYLGLLVPVIGLVQVGWQASADRYTYVPSVGMFVMLAWAVADWAGQSRGRQRVAAGMALGILAACTAGTWQQVGNWRDSNTLWEHALAVTRGNYVAHMKLGDDLLIRAARPAEAKQHFLEAVRLKPDLAKAHNNLGALALADADWKMALAEFTKALALEPDYALAHEGLGRTLLRLGRPNAAAAQFRKAVRLAPRLAEAWDDLGQAELYQDHAADATRCFQKAVALAPRRAAFRCNLADALGQMGENAEAGRQFRMVSVIDPDWPARTAREAWRLASDPDARHRFAPRAIQLARQACAASDPPSAVSLDVLAAAQAEAGRFGEAIATARLGERFAEREGRPELAAGIRNRLALYEQGRPARAAP